MKAERLEDLVSDYLDGLLPPEQAEDLFAALREDADARRYLLRASMAHLALTDLAAAKRAPRARRVRRTSGRPSRAGLWAGLAAAAAFALAALALSRTAPAPGPVVRAPDPAPAPEPEAPPPPATHQTVPFVQPSPPPPPATNQTVPFVPPPQPPPPPDTNQTVPFVQPPQPPTPTRAAVARLEAARGARLRERPAAAGDPVLEGDALAVDGAAVVLFPDGTRVEVGPGSELRSFDVRPGKRFVLARGALEARVARQDAPMVISTPHADAIVLGTTLKLRVDEATRLEVDEGRVRLRRSSDGRSAEVVAGHFAVVSAHAAPVARPLPRAVLTEGFENAARTARQWTIPDFGGAAAFSGGFTLDLGVASASPDWVVGGRNVSTQTAFRLPLRASAVVLATHDSPSTMATLAFAAPGATMEEPGHLWIERREDRFDFRMLDAEKRHLKSTLAQLPASPKRAERWDVELDPEEIRLFVNGRAAGRMRLPAPALAAYAVGVGGDAKSGAPRGAQIRIYSVRIEETR